MYSLYLPIAQTTAQLTLYGSSEETTHGKNGTHNISSSATKPLAVVVEGLQVSLVQGVTDDLDVQLVKILLTHALAEKFSCNHYIK